ncbi:MAG TPA: malto-oligosyltrehalose synthase [Acidimicrobiales bacterium]|nr:malto-oligosyltrehalose synthase [Acidimicrobiales bacterium]
MAPRATYRLQLREGMTLQRAATLVPYLEALGVSHIYTSPAASAVPGSTHGYDVADPGSIDDAIGGEDGHRQLADALMRHDMGRMVDIVPNHVAAHDANPWWRDALNAGDRSAFAKFFDVDWEAGEGRVVTDPARPNYRRFFDISGLVGLRVEDPEVFARSHALVLGWVHAGEVDALRIDHPDGLRHPGEYFARLRQESGGAWTVVEKILGPDEELPTAWQVDGTTGYEFARRVTGLNVDSANEGRMTEIYGELTGGETDWETVSRQGRLDVLAGSLSGDLERLAGWRAAEQKRPMDEVRSELVERLSTSPVYRDYPALDAPDTDLRAAQLSAAVTAKGIEDTAFYRYTRLCALNEVGGDPGRFGVGLDEFHAANQRGVARPLSLLATATHDTKWGEDVRARLCVLSEVPDEWAYVARRWMRDERVSKFEPSLAYAFLQALVGAWPLPVERALQYVTKAAREAKTITSWMEPNETYEAQVAIAVRDLLEDPAFLAELATFARHVAARGRVNSLATTLLKLTSPGVPDIYQGTEIWDDSLVDPDNRRPVDFGGREEALARVASGTLDQALAGLEEGLPKLWVTAKALAVRDARRDCFADGSSYEVVESAGRWADRVVSFARSGDVLTVVPRLGGAVAGNWGDTSVAMPTGEWTNVLTGGNIQGGPVPVGDLWSRIPVALLVRRPVG